jgi:transcription elongation factor Elf1
MDDLNKLTEEKAIELAIVKWKYIVDNGGSTLFLRPHHPELVVFEDNCALCEHDKLTRLKKKTKRNKKCENCILYKHTGYDCFSPISHYGEWKDSRSVEDAKSMLNVLLEIQKNEKEKKKDQKGNTPN